MSAWEDYVYPGTQVLRNKADIRDPEQLQRFERGVTAVRIQELKESPVRGEYDLAHLQSIHRQVFRDVYAWAGEVRRVELAKGPPNDRTVFALSEDIPIKAELIKASIQDANHLRGLNRQAFAEKMGAIYAAVNELHPFREGNGRATREFMEQLAKESGHRLDYTKVGKIAWNEAAKESARGNLAPTRQVFHEITTVERAVAFDQLSQREALARHPELDSTYKALYEAQRAGRDVEGLRQQVSRELHRGHAITADVTLEESRRVIDHAATHRGLMVRGIERLGGQFNGEVVAVSSHHVMLKVSEMVAVRYERENLNRQVFVGEHVTIQHGSDRSQVHEPGREPPRERSAAMQMEREHRFATQ